MQRCQACFLDDWWLVLPSNSPPSPQCFSCRVAKGFQFCSSRPLTFPFLPIAPPVSASSSNCLWHFCNIHVYMISSRDFSLTLSLHIRLCSFLFPFLLKLLPSYWHFCSSFSRPRHVNTERGTHLFIVTLTLPFSFPLFTLEWNWSHLFMQDISYIDYLLCMDVRHSFSHLYNWSSLFHRIHDCNKVTRSPCLVTLHW